MPHTDGCWMVKTSRMYICDSSVLIFNCQSLKMCLSIQAPGCSRSENNKDQNHDSDTDTGGWQGGFLKHRNKRSLKARTYPLILLMHNKSGISQSAICTL